jgi:hypothetical protein
MRNGFGDEWETEWLQHCEEQREHEDYPACCAWCEDEIGVRRTYIAPRWMWKHLGHGDDGAEPRRSWKAEPNWEDLLVCWRCKRKPRRASSGGAGKSKAKGAAEA